MRATRIVRILQGSYFLYCAQAWQRAAARTVWRIPVTSPPIVAETFMPDWMEGKKRLIFKLHGYPDLPDWYGMDRRGNKMIALTPALVRCADLSGAIVIALVCYGAGGEMERAFFDAGAVAFFGSAQEVRGREDRPGEVDVLVRHLLRVLAGYPQNLAGALATAKEYYVHKPGWTEHDAFTMRTFRLTAPKGDVDV